jgi:hypothetical protein
MEDVQIHGDRTVAPPLVQAPLLGEQTFEIAAELLGLDTEQVRALIARGVLEAAETEAAETGAAGTREANR